MFFIDSNSELWWEDAKRFGVKCIKMPYTVSGVEGFFDLGEKTDFKAFYRAMRNGAIPTTSALNEYDYTEYFEPYLKGGDDILYLTFSQQLSATFDAMNKAIEALGVKYPARKITVFDSKSISIGCAAQAEAAAEEFNKHGDIEKTVEFLTEFSPRTACYFAVDDLFYLKRGGRLSASKAVIGSILGVKPLLQVSDEGKILNISKIKGERRVITALADLIKNLGDDPDKHKIYIAHADCEDKARELTAAIKAVYPDADITAQYVGPVIASHCGPGTFGIAFYAKSR